MILSVDVEEIVSRIRQNLKNEGIILLKDLKTTRDDLVVSCPHHSDGQEGTPSCYISMRQRTTIDNKRIPAGTVHCFSCGYRANMAQFISKCFGHNDAGAFGVQWLIQNFAIFDVESRNQLNLDMSRETRPVQYVTEEELVKYRYTHSYMYQRKLTDDVIERFDVGYDHMTDCITFPVHDLNGAVQYIQRRSVSSKAFNNQTSAEKGAILYGLYHVIKSHSKSIYITESIIDALTLWAVGRPAVALMGAMPTQKQIMLLKESPVRHIILALDNDSAGKAGSDVIHKALKDCKVLSKAIIPEHRKDINDMDSDELNAMEVRLMI